MSLSIQNNAVRQQNYMNNKQVNFKGVYILKGVVKDIELARDKILTQHCSDDFARIYHQEKKSADRFYHMSTLWLAPVISDEQENLKLLIATNEHTPNVMNWKRIYKPRQNRLPQQNRLRQKLSNEVRSSIINLLTYIQKQVAPYEHAETSSKRGNKDPMSDFMIDQHFKMEERLKQFKEVSTVPMGDIEEWDALEVLKAIKEGRFNYITGEIRDI